MAFPCNQFGEEEPGTAAEIASFAEKYSCNFPIFEKCDVKGRSTHQVYEFLKTASGGEVPNWNFGKYLVSPDGAKVEFHAKETAPLDLSERIQQILENAKEEL